MPTAPPPVITSGTGVVTVNPTLVRQTIEGFGGSNAWTGLPSDATTRARLVKLLFSPTEGIGLTLIRNRIPFRESTTYNDAFMAKDSSGRYTYTLDSTGHKSFNLNWSNWDLQNTKTLYGLAAAYSSDIRGFSTPWTPPNNQYDRWKIDDAANGNTIGGTMGNITTWPDIGGVLSPTHYQDYADVLADYARNFKANMGYPLMAISLQNEPNYLPKTYESASWTSAQFSAFLPSLSKAWTAKSVTTPVIAPEGMNFNDDLIAPALNDSTLAPLVSIVGTHQYASDMNTVYNTAKWLTTTKSKGKRLWMTEVSSGASNDASITDGLVWARTVHADMTTAEVNAFCYWWLWTSSSSPTKGSLVNLNAAGTQITENKRLYTLGQFSRFVRPGWVRLNAETSPLNNVYSSVYRNPSSQEIAVVLINAGSSTAQVSLKLSGATAFASLAQWRTSATESLTAAGSLSAGATLTSVSLPAASVTTVYGTYTP